MRAFLISTLILTFNLSFAQKNIIKGRAIYLPYQENPTYSFGIGYERILNEKISVQVLYNSTRFTPGFDAKTTESQGFIPEVRYYFGKKEDFRKKAFIGGFIEIIKIKQFGGVPEYHPDYQFIETNGNLTSLGVLIGKNNSIGKHFLWDRYIGYRYKIFDYSNTFKNNNGDYYDKDYKDNTSGIRMGLNLGFLF